MSVRANQCEPMQKNEFEFLYRSAWEARHDNAEKVFGELKKEDLAVSTFVFWLSVQEWIR